VAKQPIDQAQAAALWECVGVTADKIRIAPRQHKGNVTFIGYADIQIWIFQAGEAIPMLTLCGTSIKLIDDVIHFDPKAERGKGDRSRDFFPHWYPKTGAARAVLTRKISEDPQIQEMVQVGVARLAEAAGDAS
jgi:hypothetical protein